MIKHITKYATIFFTIVVLTTSFVIAGEVSIQSVQAQTLNFEKPKEYTLLEPLPCLGNTQVGCEDGVAKKIDINEYLAYIFNLSMAIAAFLAVLMIVYGGFQYMTTEAVSGKGDAKKHIQNAVLGLIAVLASYLILQTIDPRLVDLQNTAVPKLKVEGITKLSDIEKNLDATLRALEAAGKEVTTLKQSANDLWVESQALLSTITDEMDQEEVDEIRAKAKALEQQSDEKADQAVLVAFKAKADSVLAQVELVASKREGVFGDSEATYFQNITLEKQKITRYYDTAIATINDPIQKQNLADEKIYYTSAIDYTALTKNVEYTNFLIRKADAKKTILLIENRLANQLPNIKNDTIKQKLTTNANDNINYLKTNYGVTDAEIEAARKSSLYN